MEPDAIDRVTRIPHGGETDPDVLDFSANTNPFTPDGVEEVYENALEEARRYPDDEYPEYRAAAAEFVDCRPDEVVPTPGGLAAIRLALEATVDPGDRVLVPYPSFGEYARETRLQGANPVFVPSELLFESSTNLLADCELVVCCRPNNPTGEAVDLETLASFVDRCEAAETSVLVDEAFLGFTDRDSAVALESDQVVVARALTKLFGLPGLRVGFAVATGPLGDRLETARRTWCLGTPAARVGAYCLEQESFVAETRERIERERERLREALEDRFEAYPSNAPYLLCDVGGSEADGTDPVATLLERTREHDIVLRDARTFRSLDSHVRIAVKDRERNDRLLEALDLR